MRPLKIQDAETMILALQDEIRRSDELRDDQLLPERIRRKHTAWLAGLLTICQVAPVRTLKWMVEHIFGDELTLLGLDLTLA
jgi:hypothetical protein